MNIRFIPGKDAHPNIISISYLIIYCAIKDHKSCIVAPVLYSFATQLFRAQEMLPPFSISGVILYSLEV